MPARLPSSTGLDLLLRGCCTSLALMFAVAVATAAAQEEPSATVPQLPDESPAAVEEESSPSSPPAPAAQDSGASTEEEIPDDRPPTPPESAEEGPPEPPGEASPPTPSPSVQDQPPAPPAQESPDPAEEQPQQDASGPAATVGMTDSLDFEPARVTVEVGQTVKWINDPSTIVHTVTADPNQARNPEHVYLPPGAEPFGSGRMQPGDMFTHTFTVPGRYKYFCIPHERAGMIGEVEVVAAGRAAEAMEAGAAADGEGTTTDDTAAGQAKRDDKTPDPGFVFGTHMAPRPPDYRQATGFMKFVYWLGNFHPAATDVPVGIMLAAFLSEILLLVTGRAAFAIITRYCVWVAGLAALGTAFLGWCLAGFDFYDNAWLLTTHRVLGSVTGVWGLVVIATLEAARGKGTAGWQWTFRAALLIATVLIIVTGYYGGAMIYGLDHYDWPATGAE